MIKIGNVQLSDEEAFKLYSEGKYIVTYGTVYQLAYTQGQVYGISVYKKPYGGVGFVRRGRWLATDAAHVNEIIGINLLRKER